MDQARKTEKPGKNSETADNPDRSGNGVQALGDTHGMEYTQVEGTPIEAAIIKTDK